MRILLPLIWILLISPAAIAEGPPNILHQGDRLRHDPGGKASADIIYSHRSRQLQRQGDWIKVQIDGYIWKESTESVTEIIEPVEDIPVLPIQLNDYSVRWYPQDFNRKTGPRRAHVVAQFEFVSTHAHELSCLDYRVNFFNLQGRPLHQIDVTCDSGMSRLSRDIFQQNFIWKEYSGPAGDVFRRLRRDARQKTVRIDLVLDKAYFTNGDSFSFSAL